MSGQRDDPQASMQKLDGLISRYKQMTPPDFQKALGTPKLLRIVYFDLNLREKQIVPIFRRHLESLQPSINAPSYHTFTRYRIRIFRLLAYLCQKPNAVDSTSQSPTKRAKKLEFTQGFCASLRDFIAPKLREFIELCFPLQSGLRFERDSIDRIISQWESVPLFERSYLQNIRHFLAQLYILKDHKVEPPQLHSYLDQLRKKQHTQQAPHIHPSRQAQISTMPSSQRSYPNPPPIKMSNAPNGYNDNKFRSSQPPQHPYSRNQSHPHQNMHGHSQRNPPHSNQRQNPQSWGGNSAYSPSTYSQNQNNRSMGHPSSNRQHPSHHPQQQRPMQAHHGGQGQHAQSYNPNASSSRRNHRPNPSNRGPPSANPPTAAANVPPPAPKPAPAPVSSNQPLTDEEILIQRHCESERKDQRRVRIQSQLKSDGESLHDEFEKFWNEGSERWKLVKESTLDRRIWDWQVKLAYDITEPNYGCGRSEPRMSPFFLSAATNRANATAAQPQTQ